MIHYGMTKTAQVAVARGIPETTAGTGVTVNSVLAGPTNSEGVGEFLAALAKQKSITAEEVSGNSSILRGQHRCSSGSKRRPR